MNSLQIIDLIYYPLSAGLISILTFILGFSILKVSKINLEGHWNGFIALFIGCIALNFLVALYITKGVSIFSCLILLLCFFLIHLRKSDYQPDPTLPPSSFKSSLLTILMLNIFWGICFFGAYFAYVTNPELVQVFYPDNYFYVISGDIIQKTGEENCIGNLNFNPDFEGGTSPYHYLMLYQNIIQSSFLGLHPLWTFLISVPVFFASMASYLVFCLMLDINRFPFNYQTTLLSFLLIFCVGYNIIPIDYIENGLFSMSIVNHVSPKYIPLYICMMLSAYCLYRQHFILALFPMLLMSIFSFLMLPVVLWTLVLGSLVARFFKRINNKELLFALGITLSIIAYLVLFYAVTGIPKSVDALSVSYSEVILSFLGDPSFVFIRLIGMNYYYVLEYILYILPLLGLLIYYRKAVLALPNLLKFVQVSAFFFIMFQGAIIATWLLHGHEEGFQVQYFTLTIGTNAFLVWVFLFALQTKIKAFYSLAVIILSVCLAQVYNNTQNHYSYGDVRFKPHHASMEFFEAAKDIFEKDEAFHVANLGGRVISEAYCISRVLYHINPKIKFDYIDDRVLTDNEHRWYATFSFYHYGKKRPNVETATLQLDYIKKHGIKYLINDATTPENHLLFEHSKLLLKDNRTGLTIREINADVLQ